jgi:1,4-alpha-glucan branching enzyme
MVKKELVKKSDKVKLTFVLPYDRAKPKIAVLGDFNGWDPKANPLVKRANGTVSASVMVEAGQRVRFRYYAPEGEWFNDDSADTYERSEYGAENSVVVL